MLMSRIFVTFVSFMTLFSSDGTLNLPIILLVCKYFITFLDGCQGKIYKKTLLDIIVLYNFYMKQYIINQIINNQLISKISVISTQEDIEALKSFILLPHKDELIKSFYFVKLQLCDETSLKTYISLAIPVDKNENELYAMLKGRYYNLKVCKMVILLMQENTWSYENHIKSIQKGRKYEEYIFKLLLYRGYKIIHSCLELQRADKGIDFIALKNDSVVFIQCKNFENTEVSHLHLKEFYANCELYLRNNSFNGLQKRFLYISSFNFLADSAKYFLKENNFIEFHVLPYRTS